MGRGRSAKSIELVEKARNVVEAIQPASVRAWLLAILLCACAAPQPPPQQRPLPMSSPLPRYCCPPVLEMYKEYKGDGIAADGDACHREYLLALGPYSRDELVNFMNRERARSIYKNCMESKGWLPLPSDNMGKWRQENCPAILRLKKETGRFLYPEQFCQ